MQVGGMCRYAEDNAELDQDAAEKMIEIDDAYFIDNAPVLREQMARPE